MSNYFIFAIFLFLINGCNSYRKYCDTKTLFEFGIKALCESESELSMSCFKNPKKAHIQCQTGYYNDKNIATQTIECMEDGEWSEYPIRCRPKCVTEPYPNSKVEIFRTKPLNDKPNNYPGTILSEKKIMSHCDFVSRGDRARAYSVRVFNNETSFVEMEVFDTYISRVTHNNNEYCFFYLGSDFYIKYNENVMPNCIADQITSKLPTDFRDTTLPVYKKTCYIPDIDTTRTEVVCYDRKQITFSETVSAGDVLGGSRPETLQVDCAESADEVIIRCQLGTNNTKSNDIPYISKCVRGEWTHNDISSNDCDLVCGEIGPIYEPETTPLLYKGLETNIISAPWYVAIFSNITGLSDSFEQICGGSIIHSNLVISAAHCFYYAAYGRLHDKSNYLVGAGKRYRSYDVHEQAEHFNGIKDIQIPSTYQSQPIRDDIAILILDHHFKFTYHIKPVCLEWYPYHEYIIGGRVKGRTFGWGSTSKTNDPSSKLLTIELGTKVNEECKKLVNPNLRSEISNDKFCATNSDNATACKGDSGGGFVIKRRIAYRDCYILAGLISVGLDVKNYCLSGFLTLFSNIQFHQNFIKSVIEQTRSTEARWYQI